MTTNERMRVERILRYLATLDQTNQDPRADFTDCIREAMKESQALLLQDYPPSSERQDLTAALREVRGQRQCPECDGIGQHTQECPIVKER